MQRGRWRGRGLGWLDTAGYTILWIQWIQDTAGYAAFSCVRVQLRSAWIQVCVQLRSGTCVQLRSAFGCVLRSAAFRNLRSAAFCVQLRSAWIQPGAIQSFWVGILCRQGRYAWTHTCCNPSLAARNVNTHAFLPGPDLCPSRRPMNTCRVCVHLLLPRRTLNTCLPS